MIPTLGPATLNIGVRVRTEVIAAQDPGRSPRNAIWLERRLCLGRQRRYRSHRGQELAPTTVPHRVAAREGDRPRAADLETS